MASTGAWHVINLEPEVQHVAVKIRAKVQLWRRRGYPEVTPTTRALLDYWNDPERDNPVLFCQREAAETAIYIAESAPKSGDLWIRNQLDADNAEHNNGLPRLALKGATGSGKRRWLWRC